MAEDVKHLVFAHGANKGDLEMTSDVLAPGPPHRGVTRDGDANPSSVSTTGELDRNRHWVDGGGVAVDSTFEREHDPVAARTYCKIGVGQTCSDEPLSLQPIRKKHSVPLEIVGLRAGLEPERGWRMHRGSE